jgi:hypothetical protein
MSYSQKVCASLLNLLSNAEAATSTSDSQEVRDYLLWYLSNAEGAMVVSRSQEVRYLGACLTQC